MEWTRKALRSDYGIGISDLYGKRIGVWSLVEKNPKYGGSIVACSLPPTDAKS